MAAFEHTDIPYARESQTRSYFGVDSVRLPDGGAVGEFTNAI